MSEEVVLPNSEYINTNLGLKYLNANKKLYLKVLNSFLIRYRHFDINSIKEDVFKNEMHSLKGLSSTLGMGVLSNLAKNLQNERTKELLLEFSKTLTIIISDLNNLKRKTLLIIDDDSNAIDNLIEILEDNYDIIVLTTPSDDLKSISTENIDLVLLSPALSSHKIKNIFEQKNISIIHLEKPIKEDYLHLAIKNASK